MKGYYDDVIAWCKFHCRTTLTVDDKDGHTRCYDQQGNIYGVDVCTGCPYDDSLYQRRNSLTVYDGWLDLR